MPPYFLHLKQDSLFELPMVEDSVFATIVMDVIDVQTNNNKFNMTYIGIDVSKDTFVAAYPGKNGKYRTKDFQNTTKGIHTFIQTLSAGEHHCVMEATGYYSYLLLYLLHEAGIVTSMENPLKIKRFAQAMLSVTKTDKLDACMIAMYGERMNPAPYKVPDESILILKQKRTVIRQLHKQLTMSRNLRKSISVLPKVDSASLKAIDKTVNCLEKQIAQLEKEMIQIAEDKFSAQMSSLTSIKGIGTALAVSLIVATGAFSYFSNAKQVSRYIGLCPTYEQSGTSVNVKGHINRNGDSQLRANLYIASWTAIRYNSECKATYERLKSNGKSGKVALIAVANKLVRQAFSIVTKNTAYIDGFKSEKTVIRKLYYVKDSFAF